MLRTLPILLGVWVWLAGAAFAAEPVSLRDEGLRLLEQGKEREALLKLGEARAQGAGDPELRVALGGLYLARGMFQKALIEYSQLLLKDPNHVEANLGRADSLIGLGDAKKAVGPAKLVTEIEPELVRGWQVLGRAYLHDQQQDYQNAQKSFQRAAALAPADKQVGLLLARALNFDEKVEEAIGVMEALLDKHPGDRDVLVKLAEALYALRKLDRAANLAQEILDKNPEDADALHILRQIRSRQAYVFWVPVIALIAFPLFFFGVRWLKKGRIPKVES